MDSLQFVLTRDLPTMLLLLLLARLVAPRTMLHQAVDLTHTVDSNTIAWPTATPFTVLNAVAGPSGVGYWYEYREFTQAT